MNTTGLNTLSDFQALAYYTNNMTDGILFGGGVIVLFIVLLLVLIRNDRDFGDALTVSSWSFFIISALLWFASLIPTLYPLGFLFLAGFGTMFMYASK